MHFVTDNLFERVNGIKNILFSKGVFLSFRNEEELSIPLSASPLIVGNGLNQNN